MTALVLFNNVFKFVGIIITMKTSVPKKKIKRAFFNAVAKQKKKNLQTGKRNSENILHHRACIYNNF
jgi:hypothetical protein